MRYKNITTRCDSMLSLGMRLPRKSRDKTRTLHACVGVFYVIGFCEACFHSWLCIYELLGVMRLKLYD